MIIFMDILKFLENKQILTININNKKTSFQLQQLSLLMLFISSVSLLPIQLAKSEEIFLKCTAKFEINRGELIIPDWETSYLTINLNGLKSYINNKGIKKEGSTLIRGNYFTITHRDDSNKIKTKYKINGRNNNYTVNHPQHNRTLIGTCQKSRG